MKFLIPVGGVTDHQFGILTSPQHRGVPIGIQNGMAWAMDNGAYTEAFDPVPFFAALDRLLPWRENCLFVVVPDCLGDARRTLELFDYWYQHFTGWSLAFVAQDEQEELDFPPADNWDVLFVGGTTGWKMGDGAAQCIRQAQTLGKHIHIGRVNTWRRYQHFKAMDGGEEFTCDGTRVRFDGTRKAMEIWRGYMGAPVQLRLLVSTGNCAGQLERGVVRA